MRIVSAKLDASVGASGPHDFTVRLSAVRQRHRHVHRIPHPTFVTTAKRPSYRDGVAWIVKVFLSAGKTNYFCKKDWTTQISLNSFGKFSFA
jgi:hypothetical protein